ncbi:MAG: peptidylprolyl isomerase [Kineosporiaceae bacterium]
MSPKRREREYAKRRYEKWLTKRAERMAKRRKWRKAGIVTASALVVIAVVSVTVWWLRPDSTNTAAASSATSTAASDPDNPCPEPTVTPPATPKSWDTPPASDLAAGKSWNLTLETSCGSVLVELDGAKAPKAVSSTIFLAQQSFYDGSVCHRLTTEGIYVLQCGDPTGTGTGGPGYTYGPVENAPADGVYPAGTVAMARSGGDGNSMGSQFFIVYKDSPIPADAAGGYTVIGKVTGGLDVVEKVVAGGVVPDTAGTPAGRCRNGVAEHR